MSAMVGLGLLLFHPKSERRFIVVTIGNRRERHPSCLSFFDSTLKPLCFRFPFQGFKVYCEASPRYLNANLEPSFPNRKNYENEIKTRCTRAVHRYVGRFRLSIVGSTAWKKGRTFLAKPTQWTITTRNPPALSRILSGCSWYFCESGWKIRLEERT